MSFKIKIPKLIFLKIFLFLRSIILNMRVSQKTSKIVKVKIFIGWMYNSRKIEIQIKYQDVQIGKKICKTKAKVQKANNTQPDFKLEQM